MARELPSAARLVDAPACTMTPRPAIVLRRPAVLLLNPFAQEDF